MTVQAGLCQTWSEPKLLVSSRTGSYILNIFVRLPRDISTFHLALILFGVVDFVTFLKITCSRRVYNPEMVEKLESNGIQN